MSLLLNGITPYVKVSSKVQNGSNDFSVWERIFNSNFHLNVGENKLTAKLHCSDDESNQITKYHSTNFTGTNETTSTPITNVLNSPSIRDDISPANITDIIESESTSSDLDDQTEFINRDQVVRNITSGPVIIPPSGSQESSMLDSSPVNDSVVIPNATRSGFSSDNNSTSPSVLIPSGENGSSAGPLVPLNNQSYSPSNQVSKEINEQRESKNEENDDDIPLILPTPSPRVTSYDDDRDDSVVDSPVRDLSPVIKVDNNNTKIEEGSLIMLNASQSYSNGGPIVSNTWKQLTSNSLEYIEGLNMPILRFRAPYVTEDTPLEFEISVSDANGGINNGIIHVLVSDVASLRSKANTSSNIPNQTVSEPNTGGMPSNVKIPDSSESNFAGSPSASNLTTQPDNDSQTTVVSNSSGRGDENGTSIRTMAGVDQIVNEGLEVSLSGDSTSTNSSGLSYEWRQVCGDAQVFLGQQNAK